MQDHVDVFMPEDHNDHVDNWKVELSVLADIISRAKSVGIDTSALEKIRGDLSAIVSSLRYVNVGDEYTTKDHNTLVQAWLKFQEWMQQYKRDTGCVDSVFLSWLDKLGSYVSQLEQLKSGAFYRAEHHNLFADLWDVAVNLNNTSGICIPEAVYYAPWPQAFATSLARNRAKKSLTNAVYAILYQDPANYALYAVSTQGTLLWRVLIGGDYPEGNIYFHFGVQVGQNSILYYSDSVRRVFGDTPDGKGKYLLYTYFKYMSAPAIAPDGTVYVAGAGYDTTGKPVVIFLALDPTLAVKWQLWIYVNWTDQLGAMPVLVHTDGTVYFHNSANYLNAVSPNGTLKWSLNIFPPAFTPQSPDLRPGYYGFSIGLDGTVYIPDRNGYLNAVSPNGTVKWRVYVGDLGGTFKFVGTAVGPGGKVYLVASNTNSGNFIKIFTPDGALERTLTFNNWITFPAIHDDGSMFVIEYGVGLRALDSSGNEVWRYPLGAGVEATNPSIGADGNIYFGYQADPSNAVLVSLTRDGRFRWSVSLPGQIRRNWVVSTG